MSFLKSAINQVGRDMGKVVSNQVFKDSHSTPYRRVGGQASSKRVLSKEELEEKRVQKFRNEFDKINSFNMGHRPSTLIAKVSGTYTTLKNAANNFIGDGYLDADESTALFTMLNEFNSKIEDVCDTLELDEEGNKKELDQLQKIVAKNNKLFHLVLNNSADGCMAQKDVYLDLADEVKPMPMGKFVLLNMFFMGGYAKTGIKKIGNTIIANLISLFFFPIVHITMLIVGFLKYPGEKKDKRGVKDSYLTVANIESERADLYREYASTFNPVDWE